MVANLIHNHPRIGLAPRLTGLGGMVSFQARLISGLEERGVQSSFDLDDPGLSAILVVGGTRQVGAIASARRRGVRIVQRLNGMNWLHRKRRTGWQAYLRAEGNNLLLAFLRRSLAHRIVYQSRFSQEWWEKVFGRLNKPHQVIYNGVNLEKYSDKGSHERPGDRFQLLLVEGHVDQANRQGLDHAVQLAHDLREQYHIPVELVVAGLVDQRLQSQFPSSEAIHWKGVVPQEKIPELDRSAHLLFSADLNAACPNSVIEALACGLPVIAFNTGALGELVTGEAGRIVPYGSNHWELEPPVLGPLVEAAQYVLQANLSCRQAARELAQANFSLDKMVDGYLEGLLG